jgi:SAM-dependent methyltransferase
MTSPFICSTCGSDENYTEHEIREMLYGSREPFSYLECLQCGSLQIQKVPSDLARHYPIDYLGSPQSSELLPETFLRKSVRKILRQQRTACILHHWNLIGWAVNKIRKDPLAPHLVALRSAGPRAESRILDVGCGPGYLLHRLRELGYKHAIGQDPFQGWTLPGVKVHTGRLEDLTGQFDLIMMHHSLEHTPIPLKVLSVLKKLSAPGGTIIVRIPLANSAAWKEYGLNWYQIDAPRHLVIPSKIGMEILAQRAGLEVIKEIFDSDETQFLCSEQYRRGIPLRDARSYFNNPRQTIFCRSEVADAKARAREVNAKESGDQACFYLRAAP